MDKLIWVLSPLLLAVAALAVVVWRRQRPSRLTLNVWSSMLLLAYVLTTAGLGIFWVANQHLPVFDWHYLFGYATVLLLAAHLAFNFRVVWRHLLQRRGAARVPAGEDAASTARPRRQALGALGVLGAVVAGGAAFWLGLRHGRTELHLAAGPTAIEPAGGHALAVVEQFHEFSAHSRSGVFRRAPGVQWGEPPPPFKAYPGALQVSLPAAASTRSTASEDLDLGRIASVLWSSAGVNQISAGVHFRTSPSSGALFATELYLRARRVPGLAPGWWHYDGRAHRLNRVADDDTVAPGPAAELVATAVFARSGQKYRDRTYRYVLGDLGHLLENARASAAALGFSLVARRLFDESLLARELRLDEAQEGVLAWLTFADGDATPAPVEGQPGLPALAPPWAPPPWPQAAVMGVTDAVHRATSLRAAEAPARTAPAEAAKGSASGDVLPLPPAAPVVRSERVLALIAQRRSVRRYRDDALPLATLGAVLHEMARRYAPVYSDAVRLDLVTHAVQGLPSTAWRYDAANHALQRRRSDILAPEEARRAALDQDVIGDAAVVIVLSIDRALMARDAGGAARGYRHAFIESGLVGERLYLAAGALGLGACAVGAFYDDEASRLVAVDPAREWVVQFAALSVPA
jgi:SagB-type dehydrogenase family enzyme